MSRRRWLLLAAGAALFWLCRHAYYVGFFNDDAFYLIGAKSLLQGRYAELQAPGAPPLVNYMPGWPLFLAPVMAVSTRPAVLQGFAALILLAGLALFAGVVEREDGAEAADWVLACAALSPLAASLSGTLLSDGPLFFLAAAALALLARPRLGRGGLLLLSAAAVWAALTRPTGLCLALAVAAALALEKRLRAATLVLLPSLAALGAWLLRARWLTGQSWNYARELAASASASGLPVLANAGFAARAVFERSLWRWPWGASGVPAALIAGVGVLSALAGARGLRSPAARAAALFVPIFLAPHLLWGARAARYFLPLIAPAAWLALRGTCAIFGGGERGRRARRVAAALALALSAAPTAGVLAASRRPATPLDVPPAAAARWLEAHAAGSTLAAEYDGRWNRLTGLDAVHIPYDVRDPRSLDLFLRQAGARWVVVEDTSRALRPAGGAYAVPTAFELAARLRAIPRAAPAFEDPASGVQVWRLGP